MSKIIRKTMFEIKAMNINFIIPFLFITFAIITNFVMRDRGVVHGNIILTAEIFIPLGVAWLGIFTMKDLVEDEGCEVLFSYPIKRARFGLSKILKYGLIYAVGILIYSIITVQIFQEFNIVSLFLQLFIESMFMMSLGYTSIILTKNSGVSIAIVGMYIASVGLFALAMPGSDIQKFSIMIYNMYTLPIGDVLILSTKTIIMGSGIMLLGYINFSNRLK
ncbi:MAG: hypothetical protein ACRC3Y_04125 [Romboutsia sp.]|uniref:hypothetical protein n=1 Tax=Romboutsia sp. TaxID=1965302 RepID=UPI003F2EAE43